VSNRRHNSGVTLLEMLVVVSIIGIMAGISFPAVTSGIDSIRLAGSADTIAAFLRSAANRCERNQVMLDLAVVKSENAIYIRAYPDFQSRLELTDGIIIAGVLPEIPVDPTLPRHFLLYPGGAPPRIGIRIANRRGSQRIVSLDPVTGVAQVERVPEHP
jgi:prepilin-type N-terminal cleavage/methylation domain-containing protein